MALSLLDLPLEVRAQIYNYILPTSGTIIISPLHNATINNSFEVQEWNVPPFAPL
ncbi:hypothetical protein PMZ80_010759 [Knufia obscura]|uniref:Uncharacterized protein n=2 Tax=Knufia TaxID=430999 RepID=A0AAN8F1X7_9EURO|nr:hypothetical protein PMZ80_010759 [Knufia obscura]KAK5949796.1 hypothetical protein OHC33_009185 [Knufia fluminis]